ncbi:MAG TPA: hypothetical protein VF411_09450 [Bacteroidia bacterium]
MSKRKKKPTQVQQQKVNTAHARNEFMAHIKHFCDEVAGADITKLIPARDFDFMYIARFHALRVAAAPNQQVKELKRIKEWVTYKYRTEMMPISVGKVTEMTFYDYFTFGVTLMQYAKFLQEDTYPNADKVKKALAPLAAYAEGALHDKGWNTLNMQLVGIVLLFSELTDKLYTFRLERKSNVNDVQGVFTYMEVYTMQTETIDVTIEGNTRPAYRIAFAMGEPTPHLDFITIKSGEVGLRAGFNLDVYIQAHALARLHERMDGIPDSVLHFNAFESFKYLKVCRNKRGDLLFEYRLYGNKTGYFKGDIIDGRVILRTFLFLTNNGTPEGEKLQATTGIMKEDTIYLNINKFSTFVNSDIVKNDRLKDIFINAGCRSILEIHKNMVFPDDIMKEKNIAAGIAKHLNLDADNSLDLNSNL